MTLRFAVLGVLLAACEGRALEAAEQPATAPPVAVEATAAPIDSKAEAAGQATTNAKGLERHSPIELCPAMCERAKELKCAEATRCEGLCREQLADMPCTEQMRAFMACALREPTAHWECGDNGVAAIRDGYCDGEQAAFVECASGDQR